MLSPVSSHEEPFGLLVPVFAGQMAFLPHDQQCSALNGQYDGCRTV